MRLQCEPRRVQGVPIEYIGILVDLFFICDGIGMKKKVHGTELGWNNRQENRFSVINIYICYRHLTLYFFFFTIII